MRAQRTPSWLPPVVLLLALLVVWELAVRVLDIADYLLPAPSEIAAALVEDAGIIAGHAVATLWQSQGQAGTPVRTTLSGKDQAAATKALAAQPSSGEIVPSLAASSSLGPERRLYFGISASDTFDCEQ